MADVHTKAVRSFNMSRIKGNCLNHDLQDLRMKGRMNTKYSPAVNQAVNPLIFSTRISIYLFQITCMAERKRNFGFEIFGYTKHIIEMADGRGIDLNHVEHVIEYGEKIAEYPDDKPYPSFLYLAFFNSKPLHVCFALVNEKECRVITTYEPSLIIFEQDYKTRRKK